MVLLMVFIDDIVQYLFMFYMFIAGVINGFHWWYSSIFIYVLHDLCWCNIIFVDRRINRMRIVELIIGPLDFIIVF